MEDFADFVDGNLAEQPDSEHEHSQHWLDAHYPFRGSSREEDGLGIELLEKPGLNGCGSERIEQPEEDEEYMEEEDRA